jgi:hypothetical protein
MVPLGRAFARRRSSNRSDPAARLNWLPTPPILAAHRTTSHLLAPSASIFDPDSRKDRADAVEGKSARSIDPSKYHSMTLVKLLMVTLAAR